MQGVPQIPARMPDDLRVRDLSALRALVDRVSEKKLGDAAAALAREVEELRVEVAAQQGAILERDVLLSKSRSGAARAVSAESAELRALFGALADRFAGQASLVTVVIPVYEKIEYTTRCLRSIATTWSERVNPRIVVVDDASPDGSAHELIGIPLVDVLCNGRNAGYLRSTNRGALLADTPYVCFLNNDTEVKPGWLDWLVRTAEEDPTVGAVGSKLVYPDGTLQEAGSIIWSDASGWNYGRGDDPHKAQYNYRRDVDFCSAASMLIRTDLLRKIGGFDDRYAPAYYEDADLCFEVRAHGFRSVYEPGSEIVHYEGISSGTDLTSGVKRYQVVNQPKFLQKWASVLERHLAPSAENVEAAVLGTHRGDTVLVIDSYVPMHDREAGSNRLYKVIKIFRELGYHVIFMPDNFIGLDPYTRDLAVLGVEVVYGRERSPHRDDILRAILKRVDVAWICRPELCSYYLPIIRATGEIPVVYDTIDLHFERERKRAELEGLPDAAWRKLQEVELQTARDADLVVTVTEKERQSLAEYGIGHVAVVPTIHDPEPHRSPSFAARSGIIFIGGYGHTPNVDAVQWLVNEIMPYVWAKLPDVRVTLLGNKPPAAVQALRSDRVAVTGFIADVGPHFEEAKLFVAPLRYGAGMKGKLGHAFSYGLPVVTTTVGIDGYDVQDGRDCFVADDAQTFADRIVRLYEDERLWQKFADAGTRAIERVGSPAVAPRLAELVSRLVRSRDVVR